MRASRQPATDAPSRRADVWRVWIRGAHTQHPDCRLAGRPPAATFAFGSKKTDAPAAAKPPAFGGFSLPVNEGSPGGTESGSDDECPLAVEKSDSQFAWTIQAESAEAAFEGCDGTTVAAADGLSGCSVGVSKAAGAKCERCWMYCSSVDSVEALPEIGRAHV